jgi:hypothetical protein
MDLTVLRYQLWGKGWISLPVGGSILRLLQLT